MQFVLLSTSPRAPSLPHPNNGNPSSGGTSIHQKTHNFIDLDSLSSVIIICSYTVYILSFHSRNIAYIYIYLHVIWLNFASMSPSLWSCRICLHIVSELNDLITALNCVCLRNQTGWLCRNSEGGTKGTEEPRTTRWCSPGLVPTARSTRATSRERALAMTGTWSSHRTSSVIK